MKILLPVLFTIAVLVSLISPGCNSTSSDNGTATLKGIVFDTTTQLGIPNATVILDQTSQTTTTSDSGYFMFQSIVSGDYSVTISKSGYIKRTTTVTVGADTVTWLKVPLIFKNIYIFRNLILDINNAADLLNGRIVSDNSLEKDIQVRDSVVGTDTLIYLRSALLDVVNPAYATYFSHNFAGTYNQSQFDSLPKYITQDMQILYWRDFPNTEGLDNLIYSNNSNAHTVCAFYLAGRYTGAVPRVFGLMYIDSAWYDASQNIRRLRVDVKINTKEQNMFNPDLKK